MTNEELILVRGGGITPSLINALARMINTIFNIGRSIGASIRRTVF